MKLQARFAINGVAMLSSWAEMPVTGDGQYLLRFPPMSRAHAESFAASLQDPTSFVDVTVWIEGLPSMAELATRLARVEEALARPSQFPQTSSPPAL